MQEIYKIYINTCDSCLPFRLEYTGCGDVAPRWVSRCDSCGKSAYNTPLNDKVTITYAKTLRE